MNIDTDAPVFARKEILIEAPLEKVWKLLTDIENWNKWQPDITSVKLEGVIGTDTTFRWKAKGLNIVSTLHTVIPHKQIGWTGRSLGMYAIHNWMLEARGESRLGITEESLSGWLTRLMLLFDPHFLEKSLENSLKKLKSMAENELSPT